MTYPVLLKLCLKKRARGASLLADKNQDAGCQRQDSHYDCRDRDMEQQGDSGEYQVDSEQEHSEVFGDVHGSLSEAKPACLHALNRASLNIIESLTARESRRSCHAEISCRLEQ